MILYIEVPVETPDEEILRDLEAKGYSVTTSVEQAIRLAEEHGVTLCRAEYVRGKPENPVVEVFLPPDDAVHAANMGVEIRGETPGLYREAPHAKALDKNPGVIRSESFDDSL